MTISEELRPCPMCGASGEPFVVTMFMPSTGRHWITCQVEDCGTTSGCADTEAKAIAAWNRRANDAPIVRGEMRPDLVQHENGDGV